MKHLLVGRSPFTTIAGYLVAILTGIYQVNQSGLHKWQDYLLPAAIALFGRLAGDDKSKRPSAPATAPLPDSPDVPPPLSTDFLRRGRRQRQHRGRNGQFTQSIA